MKYLILIPFIILSCTTADIVADKDAMRSVKVIAIVPFRATSRSADLKKEIYKEAEKILSSALVKLNYKFIPEDKPELNLADKDSSGSGKLIEEIIKQYKTSGADAVLIGNIIVNEEVERIILPRRSIFFGGSLFSDRDDEIKTQTTYKFQIEVKLVDTSNGSIILSLKNRYSDAEKDEYLPGYLSLDAYRAHTLKKLSDEIADKLNSAD
ncbi:MAG: hypothetical protein CVV49_09255 [Spirochaetae bacterium HGW-Spirochaetae-5]|nr:MAG: hypothetical protein CVV49_09255 [Spirochaetae bacterium HGW-Spirochaetae-5]